jgi:hypothetical protein
LASGFDFEKNQVRFVGPDGLEEILPRSQFKSVAGTQIAAQSTAGLSIVYGQQCPKLFLFGHICA